MTTNFTQQSEAARIVSRGLSRAMEAWEQWFDQQVHEHGECGGHTVFSEYVSNHTSYEVLEALITWGAP